jgi:hypothetical protein
VDKQDNIKILLNFVSDRLSRTVLSNKKEEGECHLLNILFLKLYPRRHNPSSSIKTGALSPSPKTKTPAHSQNG